jgi:hypothetical protein
MWEKLNPELRNCAIYRNWLAKMLAEKPADNNIIQRYLAMQNIVFCYSIDDFIPPYITALGSTELELMLQLNGIDVYEI